MYQRLHPHEFDRLLHTHTGGVEVLQITPALAAHILERYNTRNRRLAPNRVEFLTREFQAGRYIFSMSQGISFTTSKTLANGQHRLAAIVRANVTLPMAVVFNEPDETLKIIDQVKVRLCHETISLFSNLGPVTLHHVAVLKAIVRGAALTEPRMSPAEIEELLHRHWDAIAFAMSAVPSRDPHMKTMRSEIRAVIARASYSHDHEKLKQFGQVLVTGVSPNPGCPASLLFRYVYGTPNLETRHGRSETYRKTERALWAHLKNEQITRLMGANSELFPLPEER